MDELNELAVNLATMAVQGTATAIHTKINAIKTEKNIDKICNSYDEIISQLLSDREAAIRIAQGYKEELDRVIISDEDIEHLHNTVSTIIGIVKEMNPESKSIDEVEELKNLISVDTLKTMQLLGFNYKAAIGLPLTERCADAIKNLGANGKKQGMSNDKKRKY